MRGGWRGATTRQVLRRFHCMAIGNGGGISHVAASPTCVPGGSKLPLQLGAPLSPLNGDRGMPGLALLLLPFQREPGSLSQPLQHLERPGSGARHRLFGSQTDCASGCGIGGQGVGHVVAMEVLDVDMARHRRGMYGFIR